MKKPATVAISSCSAMGVAFVVTECETKKDGRACPCCWIARKALVELREAAALALGIRDHLAKSSQCPRATVVEHR